MILRTGVDLIENSRIEEAIDRHGILFLTRIFTLAEIEACDGRIPSLAGRYAVKEAVSKAFGTGIGDMKWIEIEVVQDGRNAPHVVLHGNAARMSKEHGIMSWSISISHTETHAIGLAVALAQVADD
ncbi:MAG: holo-[acyl-carrier protein] synthase [Cellvibrionaceae bacterium]|jgi:holo-[acyl-carrier protein] synthase